MNNNLTNAEKAKQERDELARKVSEMDRDDFPTANIIVAGITGTGKSTLINAVFDSQLAATGLGKPVTDEIKEYKNKSVPVCIWDTVGFELDTEKSNQAIKSIKKVISDKNSSNDQFDRIHAIWYCINSNSHRIQDNEIEFIKSLYSVDVPFIIILTQSISEDANELEKAIRKRIDVENMKNIDIIQVLAQDFRLRGCEPIEAFGLEDLVKTTLERMPELIQRGFAAAQRVDKMLKRKECEDIIYDYVLAAKNGFWDKIPLANIISANNRIKNMLIKVGRMYSTVFNNDRIDELIKSCSLDFENIFPALLNPFIDEYSNKVNKLLNDKKNDGFEVKIDKFSHSERVARMVAFYGYTFLDSVEEAWEELTEQELININKRIDDIINRIIDIMNKKLDERRNHNHNKED